MKTSGQVGVFTPSDRHFRRNVSQYGSTISHFAFNHAILKTISRMLEMD